MLVPGMTWQMHACMAPQVDSLTLLLDCGWDDRYDIGLLAPVLDALGHVDAVLISHPDPLHLGALPYLVLMLFTSQNTCPANSEYIRNMPI